VGLAKDAGLQRMELSFLGAFPSSQRSLVAEGQPVIVEIVVTETKDAEKRAQDAPSYG
jgi:hypothetical protein